MKRRAIESKKYKTLYTISNCLMYLCILAILGTIDAAGMSNAISTLSLVVRVALFTLAAVMSWAAARGFKHRIWKLAEEELTYLTRDISLHLDKDLPSAVKEDMSA